jgi:hydroxymethylglutaryl-CoA lyase
MHGQRNINCSIAASIERFRPIMPLAKRVGIQVAGVISTAVGCPYEGSIGPEQVTYVSRLMSELGVDSLSIADTTGVGTAPQVVSAMEAAMGFFEITQLSGHFHDTHGHALDNIRACLQMGIQQFDASCAGLGGCPYAPGASGNVATEKVVALLDELGIETGIDLGKLREAGAFIARALR